LEIKAVKSKSPRRVLRMSNQAFLSGLKRLGAILRS
jgi:hypothetical protein